MDSVLIKLQGNRFGAVTLLRIKETLLKEAPFCKLIRILAQKGLTNVKEGIN
ncbi:hypothetical protein DesLBE_1330 [Desulfitobacterium sp. LBE]|nr:hypothetical protein DesLBE_1330 [Desulfitobacterium sp. LBE]